MSKAGAVLVAAVGLTVYYAFKKGYVISIRFYAGKSKKA